MQVVACEAKNVQQEAATELVTLVKLQVVSGLAHVEVLRVAQ